jgi:hypothetical protein
MRDRSEPIMPKKDPAPAAFSTIDVDVRNGIGVLTLNRPDFTTRSTRR